MDIYNAISFAVMNHAIVPLCQPHLIINYDATQYKVGYDDGKQVLSILPESESHIQKKARKIKEKKGITAYFKKYMCMVNAFGNTSNPVFLIADDKMSEIDFDVHQVNGLGTTTAVSS